MPSAPLPHNRGPAAGPANRAALIAAARQLMAEQGVQVPLSRIAQEAGVGQGVLYRHFPTRLSLALAVFEDNFTELEGLAAQQDPQAYLRFRDRLIDMMIESIAFMELAVDARHEMPNYEGFARLAALVEPSLERARAAGLVPQDHDLESLALGLRMSYGVLVTAAPGEDVRPLVRRLICGEADR